MDLSEKEWKEKFDEAISAARQNGRNDLADYISLKSSNDTIRATSIKWFFDTILDLVLAFNNHGARIRIDQKENHQFRNEKSKFTGSCLKLQQGVRCLTIEAGWTRNPGDGFMRGGALVYARISHFGFRESEEELLLIEISKNNQYGF